MKKLRLILISSIVIVITLLFSHHLYSKIRLTWAADFDRQIVRVYFPDRYTANKIFISFEGMILETNYAEKYYIIEVTPDEMDLLRETGLKFEIDNNWTRSAPLVPQNLTPMGIPGYPCYETVEETYAEAQALADDNPNLASWIDVGDSWEKKAGLGGHDLMVLLLTNSAISEDKPKLFVTAAIHAEEYTSAPLCLYFAKYLVDNYGIDADATWILDYNEVHLMFYINPDGRKKAESGLPWRKNTDLNYCGSTSDHRGVDLNRNFDYQWGCCNGSSSDECDRYYRGPYAASEPEVQAVQTYMRSIFPNQRGASLNAAAPDDTTGIYIDLHSYGEVVIWPWGYTISSAPNGIQMQTLGRKFAHWNGYVPLQGNSLYVSDGSTKDFCYGEIGVPSFVFELGTAYLQSCAYYENNIVPNNLPAMIYAAKVARAPYKIPAGPDVYGLTISAKNVTPGTMVILKAMVDDTQFNNNNGTEPTQNIAAAEYYVDTPPWIKSPTPMANSMSPADGIFNSKIETVEAQIDTTDWSDGQHIIFVRGRDVKGNWGAFSAVFHSISNPGSEQVAIPIFSPAPDTYDYSQKVKISCNSSDVKIYYTTNGDDPDENSMLYEEPIYIKETTVLKARAYKNGWIPSDVASGNYVINDTDGDGLPDVEEQGLYGNDSKYDGNDDGIADSLQDNVASFHTYNRQSYITLESQTGTSIGNCKAAENPSSTNAPSNLEFLYGFFEFTITGISDGDATTATLYLPDGETFDTYYKYGPTPDNHMNHWYEFLFDAQTNTGADINGNVITLHFVDGERGDDDLTADGIVNDIGGPAMTVKSSGGDLNVTSDSGGGGGCFIATAAYGSSMEYHVKILREFRDRFLLDNSIGKAFVDLYYKYSPPIARLIEHNHILKIIVRLVLFPVVFISWTSLRIGISQTILLTLLFGFGIIGLTKLRRR